MSAEQDEGARATRLRRLPSLFEWAKDAAPSPELRRWPTDTGAIV
jgi:uncharacterized protein YeaO (DUF488 family)